MDQCIHAGPVAALLLAQLDQHRSVDTVQSMPICKHRHRSEAPTVVER